MPADHWPFETPDPGALTAIRTGRLLDVDAGEVLTGRTLLVRGDRIEAIRDAAAAVPDDARMIDLAGFTVLPGLIDCHAHLVGAVEGTSYAEILMRSAAQEAMAGVRNARDTLLAGFTSVRDVGTFRAFVDVALRDAIEEGTVTGPRMAVAGAYITVPSGGGEVSGTAHDVAVPDEMRFGVVTSVSEMRARVREILNHGADLIKVIATGAVLAPGTKPGVAEFGEEEIRAAVEEAAKYDAFVCAHAHGATGIKNAVRAGVRSIDHGSLIDDEAIALMAEHGTYLVADIYCGDYIASEGKRRGWPAESLRKNEETTDAQREGFRKAVEAGVRIAFGTDSGVYPHGWNAKQLPYMARYGLSPMGAIRAATIWAAELMGWEERVGSLTHGKYADVIAVEGDALADLRSLEDVAFVMKGGRVVKAPATGSS